MARDRSRKNRSLKVRRNIDRKHSINESSISSLRVGIQGLLIEGRYEDTKKRYVPIIAKLIDQQFYDDPEVIDEANEMFKSVAVNDPSSAKKYTEWMIKQAVAEISGADDQWEAIHSMLRDLGPSIAYFHDHVQAFKKRDINAYSTAKELEDAVKEITSKKQTRTKMEGNAVKLYEDDDVLLIRPDDKQAVMKYGSGTRWCITMQGTTYYEQYTSEGVLFYFIIEKKITDRENPDSKMAMAIMRDDDRRITGTDYFDALDGQLDGEPDSDFPRYNLIVIAHDDAKTRPLPFLARIKTGDASENEIVGHWIANFQGHDEAYASNFYRDRQVLQFLGWLSLKNQRLLARKASDGIENVLRNNEFFHIGAGLEGELASMIVDPKRIASWIPYFVRETDDELFLNMKPIDGLRMLENPFTGEEVRCQWNTGGTKIDSRGFTVSSTPYFYDDQDRKYIMVEYDSDDGREISKYLKGRTLWDGP